MLLDAGTMILELAERFVSNFIESEILSLRICSV